ncbi:MarR family winged helix-turn-helix transcriptional regulator [Candidatus Corynebacterium faecigallinarum]|uniref:MarR family winged helix-turn-helix transcriptional regulator n=1 Tax=Candidatus Corynebacterium faecigallinarum TaxID=2838528 RepID=UPI003FD3AF65
MFASAVDANLDHWLTETYRVGLTDYRALVFLSESPTKELRVSTLAQSLGLTPSSTTRLVSRLEGKGLARRDVCENDGRGVYAVIDTPGDKLVGEARTPYEEHITEILSRPEIYFPQINASTVATALTEVSTLLKS